MVKRFLIGLVLVVLVCGGLVGFNLFRSKMIGDFFANQQMPSVTISATEIKPATWTPQIEAIGTLRAAQGVDVAAQVAGVVQAIEFTANDQVEAGRAAGADRRRGGARRPHLRRGESGARPGAARARGAAARDGGQLRADARTGADRLRRLAIDASPVSAPCSTRRPSKRPSPASSESSSVDVGEYLEPGTVIATLQQLDTMRVDFTVPEQQMSELRMDQPAAFGLTEGRFPL